MTSAQAYTLPVIDTVRTPLTVRAAAVLLATMFVVFTVALVLAPWQQNVPASGRVTAFSPVERQQSIDSPVDGRIVRWHVVEGSRVKLGEPIAEIADLDPTLPMRLRAERDAAVDRIRFATDRELQIEARILELEQSLRNEVAAADYRIQQAIDRVRGASQSVEAAQARLTAARQNLDRHKQLFPKGLVSRRQLEVAEAEFATAAAETERASAALDEARNLQRTVEAERARAVNTGAALIRDARATRESARSEIASNRQALQPVEVRLNRQATQTVRAPADGIVFRVNAQPGSAVLKAGDEIASLVPDNSSPVVELWVDGNDLPLVSSGRHVRLQFEGWPAIQFVGWPSVAVGTFGGVVTLVDPTDNGQGRFRILVSPDPQDRAWPSQIYLRQGVRAKGWVLLSNVTLGFELWRQFNGFPPSTAPPSESGVAGGKKK
jgi:multidrug efflux pump subunit AcrA (membrane-fusion protein)